MWTTLKLNGALFGAYRHLVIYKNLTINMKICLTNLSYWVKLVLFCFVFLQTQRVDAGFACMENPCFHGICIDFLDRNSTHQCFCVSGFTGYECQINWDECRSNPCLNNGICWDKIDEFACECPENFAELQFLPCSNNDIDYYSNYFITCFQKHKTIIPCSLQ